MATAVTSLTAQAAEDVGSRALEERADTRLLLDDGGGVEGGLVLAGVGARSLNSWLVDWLDE